MKAIKKTLIAISVLSGLAATAQADDTKPTESSSHQVTGHIDVVSQYVLRGITESYNSTYDKSGPESDSPAVQGGLDYAHDSGFYAGYWFSSIGYSYADLDPDKDPARSNRNSVEHDLYAGYKGTIGDFGYQLGGTVYYYDPGWESTGYETMIGLSYKDFGFTAQTLLNDVTFGNKGDTYYVASYKHALPKDFTVIGKVGHYTYKKDGEFIAETAESKSSAFRHFNVALTRPIGTTGATWGLEYIVGGENRFGLAQGNTLVGSLSLGF